MDGRGPELTDSRGGTAQARRTIGITQWAGQLLARSHGGTGEDPVGRTEGVYPLPGQEDSFPEGVVLPDGYVRRTPVQVLVEAPDYRQRLVRRAVGWVLAGCAAAAAVWALMKFGIIGI